MYVCVDYTYILGRPGRGSKVVVEKFRRSVSYWSTGWTGEEKERERETEKASERAFIWAIVNSRAIATPEHYTIDLPIQVGLPHRYPRIRITN